MTAERIKKEERLYYLILMLLHAPRGLSKADIYSQVRGYVGVIEGKSVDSIEMMFERDKADIREMGLVVEIIDDPDHPDDNKYQRYRISPDSYKLADDIHFSDTEAALLMLASNVFVTDVADEAWRMSMKVRALAPIEAENLLGYSPQLARHSSFTILRAAIDETRVVKFRYSRLGDDEPLLRTVEPQAMLNVEGRWHLVGHDRDRKADRVFLLSRIVGSVDTLVETFIHDPDSFRRAKAGIDALHAANIAELIVQPNTDAAVRLTSRSKSVKFQDEILPDENSEKLMQLRINYTDSRILAEELAGYGPEVLVLGPTDLRDEVISALRAVVALHGAGALNE